MGDVLILPVVTSLPIPVDRVLDNAKHLETVLVVGYTKDGEEYFASSQSGGPENLWLLERCKKRLLDIIDR